MEPRRSPDVRTFKQPDKVLPTQMNSVLTFSETTLLTIHSAVTSKVSLLTPLAHGGWSTNIVRPSTTSTAMACLLTAISRKEQPHRLVLLQVHMETSSFQLRMRRVVQIVDSRQLLSKATFCMRSFRVRSTILIHRMMQHRKHHHGVASSHSIPFRRQSSVSTSTQCSRRHSVAIRSVMRYRLVVASSWLSNVTTQLVCALASISWRSISRVLRISSPHHRLWHKVARSSR